MVISQRLGGIGPEEKRIEESGSRIRSEPLWTAAQTVANAGDARVVILGAVEPMDESILRHLPRLEAVVRRGVGFDNVDTTAATRLGIVVANVPDASVQEVSDHALALLLSIERAVPWLNDAVREGRWAHDPSAIEQVRRNTRRLGQLTLGVVGLGRIGQAMVTKSNALYRRTVAADPFTTASRAAEFGAELVDLQELLRSSDHISLHLPLSSSTAGLINVDTLALVRPGAVLVNTSRGGLIDEAALLAAVDDGRLAGAGLDVTESEPLEATDPLLSSRRIVMTAHSAAISDAARMELASRSVDAVLALMAGRYPESIVNPEVLTSPALRIKPLALEEMS